MNPIIDVKVILGSTRQSRFSEKPGAWMLKELAKNPGIKAELLDLRDHELPFFDEAETPSYKKQPYANSAVVKWTAKIKEADAFIIIAPEYNHGYPAVLKNALDYAYQEWNNKPVGFVSYGSAMGARSVEQLRQIAVELQMAPIRNALHMPYDVVMAAGAGKSEGEIFGAYGERAQGLITQLSWWAQALKAARDKTVA
ncbi:MAG: NAD(P)H-dependent oxidoreductase [Candidatus Paceibacterota bacterium]